VTSCSIKGRPFHRALGQSTSNCSYGLPLTRGSSGDAAELQIWMAPRGRASPCPAPFGHDQLDWCSGREIVFRLTRYDALLAASKVAHEFESHALRRRVRDFRGFSGNRSKGGFAHPVAWISDLARVTGETTRLNRLRLEKSADVAIVNSRFLLHGSRPSGFQDLNHADQSRQLPRGAAEFAIMGSCNEIARKR
jgi:hypothetical protein